MEIFRGVNLVMEAAILEPRTQVAGTVLLVDFAGLTVNHVWQFTPNFAKLVLDWIQVFATRSYPNYRASRVFNRRDGETHPRRVRFVFF